MNLYNKIKRSPGGTVKKVAIELANVLQKLMDNRVVHGDLRPETMISNPNLSSLHLINFNQSRKYSDIKPEEYLLQL